MAKTAQKGNKITLVAGEKFKSITSFEKFKELGFTNFQKMERGEKVEVDDLTPALEALIKNKKVTKK
tara:strand:+ start:442 stop:642 length:201 start_codon:yes stop_codon:yes gene_type:complete